MAKDGKKAKPEHTKKLQAFLGDGFSDYIAARVLFLSRLPKQAAVLSSTAVEKCFKALLAFHGNESHGHLKKAHWNAVRNFDHRLYGELNEDFVELNRRAYLLRYTDDLPVGFNLVIAAREFLAELDHTVLAIQGRFKIEEAGQPREMEFGTLLESRDARLFVDNHVLSGQDKRTFIYDKPQQVYEVRQAPPRGLIEVVYYAAAVPKRDGFLRSGFMPIDDKHMSYDLSHLPLRKQGG